MSTTQATVAASPSSHEMRIDADALDFAQRHDLVEYLNRAAQLAIRHFTPIEPIWVELMSDPDSEEEEQKLVLNVAVIGTVQSVIARDDAYGLDFIGAI